MCAVLIIGPVPTRAFETVTGQDRDGNFGYMDYLQMRNLEADTDMRQRISDLSETPSTSEI